MTKAMSLDAYLGINIHKKVVNTLYKLQSVINILEIYILLKCISQIIDQHC